MQRYRNNGAPFPREDGTEWETEATHVPTELELRRNRHKLVLVEDGQEDRRHEDRRGVAPAPSTPENGCPQVGSAGVHSTAYLEGTGPCEWCGAVPKTPEPERPRWPMAITPQRYLQLSPEGEHADLARQVIASGQVPKTRKQK